MHQRLTALAVVALSAAFSQSARSQTFGYLTTLGTDTLAVELYERASDTITGDYATTYAGVLVHHYVIHLRGDGAVDHLLMRIRRPGATAQDSLSFTLRGDSAYLFSSRAPKSHWTIRAPGVFPMFVGVNALEEAAVTYARSKRRDSLTVPIVAAWANFDTAHFRVLMYSPDSVGIWSRVTPGLLTLDRDGHVTRASARLTTTRTETIRVAPFDFARLIATRKNVSSGAIVSAFPILSPRDTMVATIGASHIMISYGRPLRRGRQVFANGVLGDTVWRTGANGSTKFTTDRDLVIGGATIPAGSYALWTRVERGNSRYTLVFNSEIGQQCIEHHAAYDFAAVPLAVDTLSTSVEKLTIGIVPGANVHRRLQIRWAVMQLSTDISESKSRNQSPSVLPASNDGTTHSGARIAITRQF